MNWMAILKMRNRDVFTGKRTAPTFHQRKFRTQMEVPKGTKTTMIETPKKAFLPFSKLELRSYEVTWNNKIKDAKKDSLARRELKMLEEIGDSRRIANQKLNIERAEVFLQKYPTPEKYLEWMKQQNKKAQEQFDALPPERKVERTKRVDV